MASRISAHKAETRSCDKARTIIDKHDSAIFRELTGRDYGIDGIIELFAGDYPCGKIALVQLKSTQDNIKKNKRTDDVSCVISTSNARYAFQSNIPVILIYISLSGTGFYYVDIQKAIDIANKKTKKKIESQKTITVKIPYANHIIDDVSPLIEIIESYYK